MTWWIGGALLVLVATVLVGRFQRVRVNDWQRAAVYRGGAIEKILPPGVHRVWKGAGRLMVHYVDLVPRYQSVGPVEATSADRLPLRLTATARTELLDVEQSLRGDVWTPVNLAVSAALVRLAAAHPLDSLMARSVELDAELTALVGDTGSAVRLESVTLTGVVAPPEVRRMMSEVERARLEGLTALERARGEQAALRALANAARLLKDNPELERLRLIQNIGKGATVVVGDPPPVAPTRTAGRKPS